MNAQQYLSQASIIETRVRSKQELIRGLRDLSTNISSGISPDRVQSTPNPQRKAEVIDKIVDFQKEIEKDSQALIEIKKDIYTKINSMADTDYKTLLELRYLNNKKWEEIAVAMNYSTKHVFYLHRRALGEFEALYLAS